MENVIKKLQQTFGDKFDAAIIMSDINRRYLTGFKSSAGTLLITKQKAYFIIDFRYYSRAKEAAKGCIVTLQDDLYSQLNDIILKENIKSVAVENQNVTLAQFEVLKKNLSNVLLVCSDALSIAVSELRQIKTELEIDLIRKAQDITDRAFEHILDYIKPGITEKEIELELEYTMRKLGADGLAFDSIVVSGKNGASPHGVACEKAIENGDMITLDFGAKYAGYCSDMTRTVAVGKIDDESRKIYDTVLQAQMLAIDAIRAGQKNCDIDKIARDYIDNQGYKGYFGHSLGHSIGLECHESPALAPKSNQILCNNMVLTVEPGIYIEPICGVRIEDMVVIKDNGCENLTKSPKKLITL